MIIIETINIVKTIKLIHPYCMVLVKVGTFYNAYSKDAYIVSYLFKYKIFETRYKELANMLANKDKCKLDELRGMIYELCDYDVHLSYKIGLIEGIKLKTNILN